MTPALRRPHLVVVNWKDLEHPQAGGAEVFCENVAKELVALGFKVTLLAGGSPGLGARAERDGYAIRRLGTTYTAYPLVLAWLFKHRRRIDGVIDSQNGIPFFAPLALPRDVPSVMLIHHVHQEQFGMYFRPLMAKVGRLLEGPISRYVYGRRAVCTVSPSSRTEIRRQLRFKGPIFVVPNGCEGATVDGAPTPIHGERAATPTIACVGRLVPHKRWHLLIEAAAELSDQVPDLKVDLIGAGPLHESLTDLVRERGLQDVVRLHGFVSAQERDRLLARSWLTVSTSIGEGWGLSMIEAATLGVPAVAIDVPGLRDSVLDGVTGWLTPEDGLGATLKDALTTLAEPHDAGAYADRCRRWAGSLRWSATAERLHAVLAAEAARLVGDAPRTSGRLDIATIVTLDAAAAAQVDLQLLSHTDQSTFCATCVEHAPGPRRLLLHGVDEQDALARLAAAGLEVHTAEIALDLCRPRDLLSWHGAGITHSHLALTSRRCPAPLPAATLRSA